VPWDFVLIFLVLGVLLPWRGRARIRKLLALPRVTSAERLALYASTITFQWLAVAVTAWRAWARGLTLSELGLMIPIGGRIVTVALAGALLFGTLHWLNLRRMSRVAPEARGLLQALAERIVPRSTVERVVYLALALTAGLCEEFLYRGFVMAALTRAGFPVWMVIALSAILFGLAHLYQGRGGLLSKLVFGVAFGVARIAYDSLAPVILWHATVDVVAGLAGASYLLTGERGSPPS
jgi:membrane protease YdiL (CAAX protease family)